MISFINTRFLTIAVLISLTVCGHGAAIGEAADEKKVQFPAGPYTGPLDLPHIVRYTRLPMRMELEPLLVGPPDEFHIDPRHQPLFDKTLRESSDPEIVEIAALSLGRIAREKLGDISSSLDRLRTILAETNDPRIRHACALALIWADDSSSADQLFKQVTASNDSLRLAVEPSLARWKYMPAVELWMSRLNQPLESVNSVRLACAGLAALNAKEAVPALLQEAANPENSYARRSAAAQAVCAMSPEDTVDPAKKLAAGSIEDKLLTITFMNNTQPESIQTLASLCLDPSQAVAASAWTTLFEQNRESLVSIIPHGKAHTDAVVRMTAARVMQKFPSAQHTTWLREMLSDFHLEVRNVARQMLVMVAEADPALREQIIGECAAVIAGNPEDWQGIEQSLVVLAQVRSYTHSTACLTLLKHPRSEVLVTSAWLMELYPDAAVTEPVVARIQELDGVFANPPGGIDYEAVGLQMAHLIHVAALLRQQSLRPLFEKDFSKAAPGGLPKRGASMWALGLTHEFQDDADLSQKFKGRIEDRNTIPPEAEIVRRMSVTALGFMNSRSMIPVVEDAYKVDSPSSVIPGAARWALPILGAPEPPPVKPLVFGVGGWKLLPADAIPTETPTPEPEPEVVAPEPRSDSPNPQRDSRSSRPLPGAAGPPGPRPPQAGQSPRPGQNP
ncbi:MAG: hypothetical protein JNL58_05415 [Planctomyces sp.]|nr:hypothetical protein [Planctomyces sp.]